MVLVLEPGPAGTLTGTIDGAAGRSAPGGNPTGPVEISNGSFDGTAVSFDAWAYDGYHNMTSYEGQLEADTLRLAMTRETPDGVETIADVVATRVPYLVD